MCAIAGDYYQQLLGVPSFREHSIDLHSLDLPHIDASACEAPLIEELIWSTIKEMHPDKAPGPDGFSTRFYQACWPIIKEVVMRAVHAFDVADGRGLDQLNEAFIVLLPKTVDAVDIKDLRPISLIHSFAKILAKALAAELSPVIPKVVAPNQSAFVAGRSILDNFMLVQQSIRSLHRRKIPAIMLKIDIVKAFDSVSWQFLLHVLRHRGFGPRWIRRISMLLHTSSTQVLVNGHASESFWHGKGLRQGDPISPLLFIIVMDVLTALFRKAESANLLCPLLLPLRRRCCAPSSPRASRDGSGQGLADLLWSRLGLTLQLREGLSLVDNIAAQLPTWRASLLRRAGRLVLVNSKLSAMPIFHMMALDLPPSFFKCVDKLRRGFFWRGIEDAKGGCCLVAWHIVCLSKPYGGLGVLNLRLMNQALRMRWLWFEKMGMDKPWHGLPMPLRPETLHLARAAMHCSLGNGQRINFWSDRWINGQSIEQLAPNLMGFVRPADRRMCAASALTSQTWLQSIRGAPSVPAIAEFLDLWETLSRFQLSAAPDSFTWRLTAKGSYSSRDTYRAFFFGREFAPCAAEIWHSWAPLEVKIFTWLAVRKRLWTADRLARRGLPNTMQCQLCYQIDEDTTHMLLGCSFSREVWYHSLLPLRLHRFTPTGLQDLQDWWLSITSAVSSTNRREVNTVVAATLRFIWLERNSRVFEHTASFAASVITRLKAEIELWKFARVDHGHSFQVH